MSEAEFPMRFAFFLGCTTPSRLKEYETSSRAVLDKLGVTLVDIPEFNCCGYPLKNVDWKASLLATARNLALAERENLDILCLCKCGFGTLKQGAAILKQNFTLREEVNGILSQEGLVYGGKADVRHLLTVLFHNVGLEKIQMHATRSFENLKIATHYGCHALRPSEITKFDDPVAPKIFDELVTVMGAESIAWPEKLACCGGPLAGLNDSLSFELAEKKIQSATKAAAHFIVTACPFCQIQFETVSTQHGENKESPSPVRPLLYTQLLGFSMGLDQNVLGLNRLNGCGLEGFAVKK